MNEENCSESGAAKRSVFDRFVMFFAGTIDDAMIWVYVWLGDCDSPCGKIQAWARIKRDGDGMEATLKAKKKLGA